MVVVAGAVLLAACGGGNAIEATVNEHDILTEDVEGLPFEVTDFDRTPEQFAALLSVLIQFTAIEDRVAAEVGFVPTEDAIDTQVRTIVINTGIFELEPYLRQENVSEAFLRRAASHVLIERHLHEMMVEPIEEPTAEEAEQALTDSPEDWFAEVCASHILVPTTAHAHAVLDRLDAGEDFAALAAELSQDPGSAAVGGSLGCADPAGYVPEFADTARTAVIGEATGPVGTTFGAHVIVVESRTPATVEEVQQALAAELQAVADQAAFELVTAWLAEAIERATVVVDESRGTWVTEPEPRVVPPAVLQ